ncbi:MAG TPA: hypothetical protein VK992_03090, partial [Candidatus Caenarcaniphilales bacterium]|nr:hypothetical protein [Candidatus Caenarcaniphilales bacterium]
MASRIDVTFPLVVIGAEPRRARLPACFSASDVDVVNGAGAPRLGHCSNRVALDGGHRLGEEPHSCRDLIRADGQGRREPDAVVACLEHQQAALERLPLNGLGRVARVELHADHETLAANVANERRVRRRHLAKPGHRLITSRPMAMMTTGQSAPKSGTPGRRAANCISPITPNIAA